MSEDHKFMILDTLFNNKKSDFKEIVKIIKDTGAIKKVEEICNQFSETCFKELETFSESNYKKALIDIVKNINARVS